MSVSPQRRRRRSRILLNLSFGVALAMCAGAPAQAAGGLLERLFGPSAPAPQVYAPQPVYSPRTTHGASIGSQPAGAQIERKARKRTAGDAPGAGKRAGARPEVLSGPLGAFLRDPTLKRGDVVVTSQGLKIYTGAGGRQHSDSDFVALSQGGRYVAGNTGRLIEIERANRHLAKPAIETSPAAAPTAATSAPVQQRQAVSEGGKTL